eukprot:9158571-Alexandrium_andersonii.AAC.1
MARKDRQTCSAQLFQFGRNRSRPRPEPLRRALVHLTSGFALGPSLAVRGPTQLGGFCWPAASPVE